MSQERIEAAAIAEFNSIWRGASWDGPMNPTNEETREKFRASTAAGLAAADAVMFSDEAMEHLEHVLYAHREGALTCYDHAGQPGWCCVCGEHAITETWREHMARAVVAALKGEQ